MAYASPVSIDDILSRDRVMRPFAERVMVRFLAKLTHRQLSYFGNLIAVEMNKRMSSGILGLIAKRGGM